MSQLERIIALARQINCSDIHLTEGEEVCMRRPGRLLRLENQEPVNRELILSLTDQKKQDYLLAGHDLDFSTGIAAGRQRINIFWQSGKLAAAIRLLSDSIPSLEELKLPPVIKQLADEPLGLVLVTGPTGSGKSTTLAAMIDYINHNRSCHIITIEDPIEYIYSADKSLIHQREVGSDVESFAAALRSALREDPDVILVGEMRDYETISAAITAAETGHLVLSTLHTTGAARTVDRIIDVFPAYAQNQIKTQLAGVLKGVITQKLLPLQDGSGRIAGVEIMLVNDAIQNLIRESKCHQINSLIQSGAAAGMQTMEGSLAALVRSQQISIDTALAVSASPSELQRLLR